MADTAVLAGLVVLVVQILRIKVPLAETLFMAARAEVEPATTARQPPMAQAETLFMAAPAEEGVARQPAHIRLEAHQKTRCAVLVGVLLMQRHLLLLLPVVSVAVAEVAAEQHRITRAAQVVAVTFALRSGKRINHGTLRNHSGRHRSQRHRI